MMPLTVTHFLPPLQHTFEGTDLWCTGGRGCSQRYQATLSTCTQMATCILTSRAQMVLPSLSVSDNVPLQIRASNQTAASICRLLRYTGYPVSSCEMSDASICGPDVKDFLGFKGDTSTVVRLIIRLVSCVQPRQLLIGANKIA